MRLPPAIGARVPFEILLSSREPVRLGISLKHDTARTRGILRDIFGPIRLVQEDQAVFAQFAARTERLLVAGSDSLLGRVAGTRFRNWKHSHFGLGCGFVNLERRINSPSSARAK